jgi:hypothetical protein
MQVFILPKNIRILEVYKKVYYTLCVISAAFIYVLLCILCTYVVKNQAYIILSILIQDIELYTLYAEL